MKIDELFKAVHHWRSRDAHYAAVLLGIRDGDADEAAEELRIATDKMRAVIDEIPTSTY